MRLHLSSEGSLMRLHLSSEGSPFYLLFEYLGLLVENLSMVFTHHILTEC
tara:strand:- start:84 stop:233 length:150 start_codon:yes stop_codon:yes gene_type:complete